MKVIWVIFLLSPFLRGEVRVRLIDSFKLGSVEVKFNDPVIYIGDFSGGGDFDYVGVSVDGGTITKVNNVLYVNRKKFFIGDAKEVWVDSAFRVSGKDRKLLKAENLGDSDSFFISRERVDEINVPSGYVIKIRGLVGVPGGTAVRLGRNHLLFSRGNIVVKIWDDEIFVWGQKIDLPQELSKARSIVIDGLNGRLINFSPRLGDDQ